MHECADEADAAVRFQGERIRWRRMFFEGRPLSNEVRYGKGKRLEKVRTVVHGTSPM